MDIDEPGRVLSRSRSWTDLPIEILSSIADRLSIIELFSFRGTCKDFRSASSTASAEIGLSTNPWLLLHKPNTSECLIYNEEGSKTYKRNLPDLEGTTCLASYQGWLLVFKENDNENEKSSVFFFSPFSLTKIALPEFPHNKIEGHVATFSDIPTSPKCIVSVLNPLEDGFFEINMISKGQTEWTQQKISRGFFGLTSNLTAATFDHKSELFYYMDDKKSVLTFSAKDKKWQKYTIVDPNKENKDAEPLPYAYRTHYLGANIGQKRNILGIEDDEHVFVCGLTYQHPEKKFPMVLRNEVVDSSPSKTRMRKAVWIQPRFFEANANHHW